MKLSDIMIVILDAMLLVILSAMGLRWLSLLLVGAVLLVVSVFAFASRKRPKGV